VLHVRLDRLRAEEESLTDASVRAALGHQGEHLALALGELVEPALRAGSIDEPRDDRRVDDTLAVSQTAERVVRTARSETRSLSMYPTPPGCCRISRIA
jgi:hypothetical protein